MFNTVKKFIYPCNRKKNMKRIVILMAVLGLSMSNLQAMQLALKSNDGQVVMLDASKVPLFGMIKDVVENAFLKTADGAVDYGAQKEPIPLRYISSEVLKRLMRDTDDAQMNDDNSLTIERAKPFLDGAIYLGASISTKKYASIMAKRLVSDQSMRSLHDNTKDHPAFSLSEASKQVVCKYMPQIWGTLNTIKHDNCVLSMAFSPDGELLATGSADNNARICACLTVENPLAVHYLRWCRKKGYACNEDEWISQALAEHRYKKALENMILE